MKTKLDGHTIILVVNKHYEGFAAKSRMIDMTTEQQYTANSVECKAVLENNEIQILGTFHFSMSLDPKMNELDALIATAEAIGQMVKERVAVTSLEASDQRATAVVQRCADHCAERLHKNGKRPFTIITAKL